MLLFSLPARNAACSHPTPTPSRKRRVNRLILSTNYTAHRRQWQVYYFETLPLPNCFLPFTNRKVHALKKLSDMFLMAKKSKICSNCVPWIYLQNFWIQLTRTHVMSTITKLRLMAVVCRCCYSPFFGSQEI